MFRSLVEEVRLTVEGNRRPGRKTRSQRRQEKLGKRYSGLIKTIGRDYGKSSSKDIGRSIAKDVAVPRGTEALKGGEVAQMRVLHRGRKVRTT